MTEAGEAWRMLLGQDVIERAALYVAGRPLYTAVRLPEGRWASTDLEAPAAA